MIRRPHESDRDLRAQFLLKIHSRAFQYVLKTVESESYALGTTRKSSRSQISSSLTNVCGYKSRFYNCRH